MHRGKMTPASAVRASEFEPLQGSISSQASFIDDYTVAQLYAASVTAWVCANRRATLASSFPIRTVDGDGKPIEGGYPVADFVNKSREFLWHISTSLLLWGVCVLRKRQNASGLPTGLEWVNPLDVNIRFDNLSGRIINYQMNGEFNPIPPTEMIYIREFNPIDSTKGLSRFAMVLDRLRGESSISQYAANFFMNSARPDGIMSFEGNITEPELKEHQNRWKVFKGVRNAFRTFFAGTSAGGRWRWEPVQANPIDLAMNELKDDIRLDICAIMEVNPVLVGLGRVADQLSASGTFRAIQDEHNESVELPFVSKYISAIDQQWVKADFNWFGGGGTTLEVDAQQVIGAGKATLERSQTAAANIIQHLWSTNEGRKHVGAGPDDKVIQVNPDWALAVYQGGVAKLNEARTAIKLPPLPVDGFVWEIDPTKAPAPAGFGGGFPAFPQSKPPALLEEPKAVQPQIKIDLPARSVRGGPSAYAILCLPNNQMIKGFADSARAALVETPGIHWVNPSDYHVTLCHSPLVSSDQLEQIARDMPGLANYPPLEIEGFSSFEAEGPIPLILTVKLDEPLKALQKSYVDLFEGCGCQLSPYSEADQYTPHITLAYLPAGTAIPDSLRAAGIVKADSVQLSQDDFSIIASTGGRAAATDSPFLSRGRRSGRASIRLS